MVCVFSIKKIEWCVFFRYRFPGTYRRIFPQVRMEDIQSLILLVDPNPEPSSGVLYLQTREQGTVDYDRTPSIVIQYFTIYRFILKY